MGCIGRSCLDWDMNFNHFLFTATALFMQHLIQINNSQGPGTPSPLLLARDRYSSPCFSSHLLPAGSSNSWLVTRDASFTANQVFWGAYPMETLVSANRANLCLAAFSPWKLSPVRNLAIRSVATSTSITWEATRLTRFLLFLLDWHEFLGSRAVIECERSETNSYSQILHHRLECISII